MSDVSCSDIDANSSPPKNSNVKISTYTGFRLKGAAGAVVPGGPGAPLLLLAPPTPAAPGRGEGFGDGFVLLLGVVAGCILLLPAACEALPALLL